MNAEVDISHVTLKTERLLLRPWQPDDLDDLFEYASVDGVGQMAGWPPHQSKDGSRFVLNNFIREKTNFALQYGEKVIGSLGVKRYDEARFPELYEFACRELGFVLAKPYWGQGLMPEAVREVIRYLFEDVRLDMLLCGHFLTNTQSARVQEKCGFRHYAYGKYQTLFGTVVDDEMLMLTRQDWEMNGKD